MWDAGMWGTDLETLQELLSLLFLFPQYQNIPTPPGPAIPDDLSQKQEQGCHR